MRKKNDLWALWHDKFVELEEKYSDLLTYTIELQNKHIKAIDEQIEILRRATEAEKALKRILNQGKEEA